MANYMDPTIKTTNKFFLTRENPNGINEDRIYLRTHLPRILSLDDARELAFDLLSLAGPSPVPVAPPAPTDAEPVIVTEDHEATAPEPETATAEVGTGA